MAVVTGTKLYRSIACTTSDWWRAGHVTPELGPDWWVAAKLYRSISSDQHKGGTRPSRNWDICCRLFLWYQHHIQMGQCGWILKYFHSVCGIEGLSFVFHISALYSIEIRIYNHKVQSRYISNLNLYVRSRLISTILISTSQVDLNENKNIFRVRVRWRLCQCDAQAVMV